MFRLKEKIIRKLYKDGQFVKGNILKKRLFNMGY